MSDKNKEHLDQKERVDYHKKENQYNKKKDVKEVVDKIKKD